MIARCLPGQETAVYYTPPYWNADSGALWYAPVTNQSTSANNRVLVVLVIVVGGFVFLLFAAIAVGTALS